MEMDPSGFEPEASALQGRRSFTLLRKPLAYAKVPLSYGPLEGENLPICENMKIKSLTKISWYDFAIAKSYELSYSFIQLQMCFAMFVTGVINSKNEDHRLTNSC